MSHKNKISLIEQVSQTLGGMFFVGQGQSKHFDKALGLTQSRIYSRSTVKSYIKHACYFVRWAHDYSPAKADLGHKPRTLAECRPYADVWIKSRSNLSPYTQKLDVAALAKLYRETARNFAKTAPRTRAGIKRSRGTTKTDKHFSESNHIDMVQFCKSTGLRRRELSALRGSALVYRSGKPYLHVTDGTKGGRCRYAPIIGTDDEISAVVAKLRSAGDKCVWARIPSDMDVHSYRADYANALYRQHARPLDQLTRKDKYICRRDLRGVVYDRRAMAITSHALGHNRLSIIAGNYLHSQW